MIDLGTRIRGVIPHLSPAERRVAGLLEREPARVAQLTVTELAREAATSTATVVRAAKSLGFDGYPQLRYALASQAGAHRSGTEPPRVADITDEDGVGAILTKLAAFECEQITATADIVSASALETTAQQIARSRRCCLFGIGASALVAQDLAQKISRIGLAAFVHPEFDAAVVAASLLGPQDVAVAFSHSGETPGLVRADAPSPRARRLHGRGHRATPAPRWPGRRTRCWRRPAGSPARGRPRWAAGPAS